jgi:hypothetical protein
MPKRVVVNVPGTSRTRSSTADSPNKSIVSALTDDTERGVSMSSLLKPKAEVLGAFGNSRNGICQHVDITESAPLQHAAGVDVRVSLRQCAGGDGSTVGLHQHDGHVVDLLPRAIRSRPTISIEGSCFAHPAGDRGRDCVPRSRARVVDDLQAALIAETIERIGELPCGDVELTVSRTSRGCRLGPR